MLSSVLSLRGLPAAALLCVGLCAASSRAADNTVRFDFETGDLQGWRVVEGAFRKLLNDRVMFRNRREEAFNKQGKYFLDTVEAGADRQTGVVESPVFLLEGPDVSLMVGGGQHADTYVALCLLDGTEAVTVRGRNDEVFERRTLQVPELVGRKVFVRIVDRNRGGWGHVLLDDFQAVGRLDQAATKAWIAQAAERARAKRLAAELEGLDSAALRRAIEDLSSTFGDRYPAAAEYLDRLVHCEGLIAEARAALEAGAAAAAAGHEKQLAAFKALQRDALLANPLVSEAPILFVVRQQYARDHHNTATIFQTDEINTRKFRGPGAIKVIDLGKGGEVRTLLETPGVARDPEVSFDGHRIVFSMRHRVEEDYKIYTMAVDGSDVKQLTSAKGVADIDPLFLPDGGIVFSSTREPKYCMCNVHIMANLFRMEADGSNIHQIGKSTLFEGHASLLPDGRILYDRWEYVDRNFGDAQGLWTVYPDGTNHAIYWGNNTNSPGGVIDARAIPGTQRTLCVFGSCHDRPWGALAIIDRRLGVDGREPVIRTWPAKAIDQVGRGGWDSFMPYKPKYEDPYPLSDKYFLCSRTVNESGLGGNAPGREQMGLFLVDVFGNETLIHTELPGCYDPMPIRAQPTPPTLNRRRDYASAKGTFHVLDVYEGTHMAGVERGTVKYLRVIESPQKRFWTRPAWGGQGVHRPAMNWHDFSSKRILGTVPVEADGSAYFEVPADTFVFFQLLDADKMMVQSMRSGTMLQPGENAGCVGCHENRRVTPPLPAKSVPAALLRAPNPMTGWYGKPRLFSFMTEVQPVLDQHCVRCHDYGKKAGQALNLARDRTMTFNTAYNELWRRKGLAMSAKGGLMKTVGAGPAAIQPPRSWGAHASKLIAMLRAGHQKTQLAGEPLARLVTWVDLNAPYYPTYASAYPANLAGRCPLDNAQLGRLTQLTGVDFRRSASHGRNPGPQVSFDRPHLSPCLSKLKGADPEKYAEALAIIDSGRKQLEERPRADMQGFVPCEKDRERAAKYSARVEQERRCRAAICAGERVYDTP